MLFHLNAMIELVNTYINTSYDESSKMNPQNKTMHFNYFYILIKQDMILREDTKVSPKVVNFRYLTCDF